jgi:hypothetical protein
MTRTFQALRVGTFVVIGLLFTTASSKAADVDKMPLCSPSTLPAELQDRLKADFVSWKIQDVSNLSRQARERWQSENPVRCPGLAVGEFERANQASYALLLVPSKKPDAAYRLLIFTPGEGNSPSVLRNIVEWSKGGAANNFIHSIRIAKVFSPEWVSKLDVKTKEGLLFCDSGENEYEVDVFFWSEGQYRNEPIDY